MTSNTAITLDGRIAVSASRFVPCGSAQDQRFLSTLRSRADAVLVGGNSFRCTPIPLLPGPEDLPKLSRPLPFWNIIVSRSLALPFDAAYLAEPRIRRLVLTAAANRGTALPCELACPQAGEPTPPWIVSELAARGIANLLIEAGGDLIYQFVAADLIDELFVTLCPVLLGCRGAPALADGPHPLGDPFRRLSLEGVRVEGDEVFLHYVRRGARAASPSTCSP
ncbi:MAG: RibD family protein [Candidatus Schekmanbacteria bacterium]|nr:RibD family protein [Candidatus Schekmanbacteria bacterium]